MNNGMAKNKEVTLSTNENNIEILEDSSLNPTNKDNNAFNDSIQMHFQGMNDLKSQEMSDNTILERKEKNKFRELLENTCDFNQLDESIPVNQRSSETMSNNPHNLDILQETEIILINDFGYVRSNVRLEEDDVLDIKLVIINDYPLLKYVSYL